MKQLLKKEVLGQKKRKKKKKTLRNSVFGDQRKYGDFRIKNFKYRIISITLPKK